MYALISPCECSVSDESKGNRDNIEKTSTAVAENMKGEINKLKSEIDRPEEFSRRDTLRIHGSAHSEVFEDYDTCAKVIVDVLNRVD